MISAGYLEQQRTLHQNPDYGAACLEAAPLVAQAIAASRVTSLLDYGCGKGRLFGTLSFPIEMRGYDPAVAEYSEPPQPADMVTCLDVLEHIEPEHLSAVLDHIASLMGRVGLFTIHTAAAFKTLPDGRNAHLIQKPLEWWLPVLWDKFELMQFKRSKHNKGFWVIVRPLNG